MKNINIRGFCDSIRNCKSSNKTDNGNPEKSCCSVDTEDNYSDGDDSDNKEKNYGNDDYNDGR